MSSKNGKKIIFSDLSYKTTEQTLISYFSIFGQINEFDLSKDDQEQSLRTGYVEFTDINAVNNVMRNRPHSLDNRQISVRRAISKVASLHGGVAEYLGMDLTVNEIFINRLCSGETKEMFVNYFQQFGTIVDCRVINSCSQYSGQVGYAFVRFADYDSVDQIILARPHIIHSHFYHVRKCIPQEYSYILSSIKSLRQKKSIWRHYGLGLINMQNHTIIYPARRQQEMRKARPMPIVHTSVIRSDRPQSSSLPSPNTYPASDFIDIASLSLFDATVLKVSVDSQPPPPPPPVQSLMKKSPTNEFEIIHNNSMSSSTMSIINTAEDFTPLHSPLFSTAIAQSSSPPDVVPACDKIEQKSMINVTDGDEKKSCDLM